MGGVRLERDRKYVCAIITLTSRFSVYYRFTGWACCTSDAGIVPYGSVWSGERNGPGEGSGV